ncbi:MAG: nucleotidyltransferase family protein, partial [Terriglobales bacterium]
MNLETGAPPIHPSSVTASCTSPAVSLPGRTAKRRAGQFDREFDFLLLCVTYAHGSRIEDIHKHIAEGLNWQALFEITRHHRLIPQVYTALRGIADLVPSEPLAKLHNLYQANIRQTLRLTRDLLRVMKHFESRGIPVLAYKGPALATILNGDISGRQFADLDLLVHPTAVDKSKAALAELGYTPQFSLTDHQEEIFIQSGYESAFDLPDAQNVLELKWRIL